MWVVGIVLVAVSNIAIFITYFRILLLLDVDQGVYSILQQWISLEWNAWRLGSILSGTGSFLVMFSIAMISLGGRMTILVLVRFICTAMLFGLGVGGLISWLIFKYKSPLCCMLTCGLFRQENIRLPCYFSQQTKVSPYYFAPWWKCQIALTVLSALIVITPFLWWWLVFEGAYWLHPVVPLQ
jgi:hypothetical protein